MMILIKVGRLQENGIELIESVTGNRQLSLIESRMELLSNQRFEVFKQRVDNLIHGFVAEFLFDDTSIQANQLGNIANISLQRHIHIDGLIIGKQRIGLEQVENEGRSLTRAGTRPMERRRESHTVGVG